VKKIIETSNASSGILNKSANSNLTTGNLLYSDNIINADQIHFREMALYLLLIFLIGIILFIFYFLLLTKSFSDYLGEIITGINDMSMGDFNSRIEIKNDDEFALIAERLNKMSEEIRVLMENERKTEHMKNDLITNVAHDLRTPLTSILGYLELARKESPALDEDTRRKYIAIAYDKSKRLEKLIEDLFSYTKFYSGEVALSLSEIDMVKLMEQMIEEFYPSFQEAELEYEFTSNDNSAVVMADGDLMARAFANLISNAVKYGCDGKSIRVKLVKSPGNVSISIINYGEVIPEQDLSHIFDRFYRVENSRSRETGGSGLGLGIAKSIIEMHHGTIQVSSGFEGTVFEVVLDNAVESHKPNKDH
jgi:Signal transduction histidine kinase